MWLPVAWVAAADESRTAPCEARNRVLSRERSERTIAESMVRRWDAPGFVRLEVTDEAGQVIEVDLAYDARLLSAQRHSFKASSG